MRPSLVVACLVLVLAGPLPVRAEDAHAFSLRDALRTARTSSPAVRGARARAEAAAADIDAARAGLLPALEGSGESTRNWSERSSFRDDITGHRLGLSLTQPLLDTQASGRVKQARWTAESAGWDATRAEQELLLQVADVYVGVLESRELALLAQANHQLSLKHLESTKTRFECGELTRTDVARAQTRAELSRATWLSARTDVARSNAGFEEVVGIAPPEPMAAVEVLMPVSVDATSWTALVKERADLMAAGARAQSAREGVQTADAARLPTLLLEGTTSRGWSGSDKWRDPLDEQGVGISVRVPLYTGGEISAKVRAAEARTREAAEEVERLRRQAMREVAEQGMTLGDLLDTVEAQKKAARAAEDALDWVREEYAIGSRTALDYLGAQEDLFNAQTSLARAMHAVTRAKVRLQHALGRLSEESFK